MKNSLAARVKLPRRRSDVGLWMMRSKPESNQVGQRPTDVVREWRCMTRQRTLPCMDHVGRGRFQVRKRPRSLVGLRSFSHLERVQKLNSLSENVFCKINSGSYCLLIFSNFSICGENIFRSLVFCAYTFFTR